MAESQATGTNRRKFLKTLAVVGVGGQALLRSGSVRAAVDAAQAADPEKWPAMPRRKLGRTNFEGSRLIFGSGAALSRGRKDDLLQTAFDAGINVFDVGTSRYYNDAERNLSPFLKRVRDDVFLISKAPVYLDIEPNETITLAQSREAAKSWSGLLDESLGQLRMDGVDAYYLMASNNPSVIRSEEIRRAFERARDAGKVKHLGLSTHQNAENVLEAAIATGWYDLAMLAITPGGWYDWQDKSILAGSPPMTRLQPLLARARESGMGLIGMKAGRYLAGRKFLGWGKPDAFDEFYEPKFLTSGLSPYQRSYAFVLEHGLDAVNADMQKLGHLRENFAAAATSSSHFA